MLISAENQKATTTMFDQQVAAAKQWFASPRFDGITRLYSPRQVAEQQGTISGDYTVAREAAEAFYARLARTVRRAQADDDLWSVFAGPSRHDEADGNGRHLPRRLGTSPPRDRVAEDPGPDLASYPLGQVPDEAAGLVRALLTADKNQHFARARMTEEQRKATPAVDFRPFIIADADTGHGGDAHVRNLIRRFVEVGVPGYHIEDQKPGAKKCGHQGGKVLVAEDEQIRRLNAARLQLDIMRVPGIIVARTDAESATFIENRSDERDQPFILGATNVDLPSYKAGIPGDPQEALGTRRRRSSRAFAFCRVRSRVRGRVRLAGASGVDVQRSRERAPAHARNGSGRTVRQRSTRSTHALWKPGRRKPE